MVTEHAHPNEEKTNQRIKSREDLGALRKVFEHERLLLCEKY
jgi:hypothetical protein